MPARLMASDKFISRQGTRSGIVNQTTRNERRPPLQHFLTSPNLSQGKATRIYYISCESNGPCRNVTTAPLKYRNIPAVWNSHKGSRGFEPKSFKGEVGHEWEFAEQMGEGGSKGD